MEEFIFDTYNPKVGIGFSVFINEDTRELIIKDRFREETLITIPAEMLEAFKSATQCGIASFYKQVPKYKGEE
jgi:hypothetical protein